jgi:hypothetical protein
MGGSGQTSCLSAKIPFSLEYPPKVTCYACVRQKSLAYQGDNMKYFLSAAAGMGFSLAASFAFAQGTGSEGYFQVYNNTEGNIAVGFYTNGG